MCNYEAYLAQQLTALSVRGAARQLSVPNSLLQWGIVQWEAEFLMKRMQMTVIASR